MASFSSLLNEYALPPDSYVDSLKKHAADLGIALSGTGVRNNFSALTALYAASSLAASFWTARRTGCSALLLLPLVFATYHVSYGLGFLMGLLYRPASSQPSHVVTELTR